MGDPLADDQTEIVIGEGVAVVMEDDALNSVFERCHAMETDFMPQYQGMGLHTVKQNFCIIMDLGPTPQMSTNILGSTQASSSLLGVKQKPR